MFLILINQVQPTTILADNCHGQIESGNQLTCWQIKNDNSKKEQLENSGIRSNMDFCCFVLKDCSVQCSCSVVSDSLRPHELQHARPPCPSPTTGVHSDSRHRVSDAIQPSHPLSAPSPPAPNPSQHQSLFQ